MGRTFVPTQYPLVNVVEESDPNTGEKSVVGYITQAWRRFQENGGAALSPGSVNEVLTSSGVAFVWQKLVDANISATAAIAWSKVSKAGSSLADLATRSAADLTSGTLAHARKWSQATTTSTGTQNNFSFAGADSVICNNAIGLTLTGISAGVAGQRLTIWAINSTVTLNDQDAGSSASNRIITGTGAAVVLTAAVGRALVEYDAATQRWRLLVSA